MNKKKLHNTRENRIKSIFAASRATSLVFSSGSIFFLILVLLVISIGYVFFNNTAVSAEDSKQTFGILETTNIFPTRVSAEQWQELDEALSHDLPDYALFQDFDRETAAFLGESQSDSVLQEIRADGDMVPDSTPAAEESVIDEIDPIIDSQSESIITEPTSYLNRPEPLLQRAVAFPLAQLSMTSSTDPVATSLTPQTSEQPELVVPDVSSGNTATSTDQLVAEGDVVSAAGMEILPPQEQTGNDIKFTNFKSASLARGQFVDSLQLRLSLAAQAKPAEDGSLPYIDVLFKQDAKDSFRSVGSILIDEEVSNAINGGYYLFTLPTITNPELLGEVEVMLRIIGSSEQVRSVQLDAVWLELNARSVTPADLEARTDIEQFAHLEPPKITTLISEELNFAIDEAPVFNLRYESQQNFLVKSFMKLFGRDELAVKAISVNHESVGHIEITPEITIAGDGLVTIELPGDELDVMRPGLYEINMLFEENGEEFTETFDFQWGMLTINPHKTSYEVGEAAVVSIGALSPSGNTLCEESLALYITSPSQAVTKVPVEQSGKCNGNNVIDVPDYTAVYDVTESGEYQMYLERLDEAGGVLGFTTDTFFAEEDLAYHIERNGPTRIFPPASYPMSITVSADDGFTGSIVERVPASFMVSTTTATIVVDGEWQILSWDVSIPAGGSQTVSYGFDAPDISPYIYRVGEASLERQSPSASVVALENSVGTSTEEAVATTTESVVSTEETVTPSEESSHREIVFAEHRQWQIASDATGSMILMWDGPVIPTGWTCISCSVGDVFFQRFIMGSGVAGTNGGSATHTHTAVATVAATTNTVTVGAAGGLNYNTPGHPHTFTPIIGTANNLPAYRNLVIIQHNSAGEPTSIPAGAIAIFDAAVPTGWTAYTAQHGFYVRGESIANRTLTGGSNTHTHTITGTTGVGGGSAAAAGGGVINVSNVAHTHTISSNTAAANSQPPYIDMIIGKLNSTSTMPNGVIGMWSDDAPTDWNLVSGSGGILENRFFRPSATYGSTGGSTTETPANVNGIVSSGPSSVSGGSRGGTGSSVASSLHTHSVNVTGFSTANIVPLNRTVVFAKRAGGQPPAAPVIHELFNHEKVGDATPEFEFTTNDSVGTDSLIYQFQWDTDADLDTARIGDRVSDDETGCSPNCFQNTVTGGDTSPFNENERIRFTIQDTLTNGTTYYYRVRARKAAGTTWGSWTDVNTFTYVADTDPSQWLQTTDAQFATGTLFDAEVSGSDSVRILQNTPTEALVAYGEGSITTPRYRLWSGSSWSAELDALDVGGVIQWVKTEPGTRRDEYILGTHDANNDVNVQVFNGVTNTWGNLLEVTATANDTTRRAFDVVYETNSGDAMVVYCTGTDAAYRIWNGSSWSSATTITTASTNACHYISLAADPTSDEIIMVTRDNSAGAVDYEAMVWNGSSWGNTISFGTIVDTNNEGMAIVYEESGGQALVVSSNGTAASFLWSAWNGLEWSTPLAQGIGNDFQWGILKRDVGTDRVVLCYVDTDGDIGIVRWLGESWTAAQEFETGFFTDAGRGISCEFETIFGRDGNIIIPYSDGTNSRWRDWNGTTLAAESSISTITEAWEIGTARTGDGKVLAYFHDSVNTNYDFSWWDGTVWSTIQTLETAASVTATPFRQPIHMSAQVFVPSNGTITSDPIAFSSVPNRPTWGEAVWQTTEPSGTDIKLQVMFATSSSCSSLVPDGVLPGNSAGFDVSASPLNLSTLSTSTYSSLCLRATLTSSNLSTPTLDDWSVTWERQPFLTQTQFRWYANRNSETPNDVWPVGSTDLAQNDPIPIDHSPGVGDTLRLRMSVQATNAALLANEKSFKLQFSQESGSCASSTTWFDVGAVGSTTATWRGFNNLLAFDGSTISTLLLSGSDVGASYEEENNSSNNPNTVTVGNEAEWDWVLEHNGATDGAQYCFRMVTAGGEPLQSYTRYPSLITNASPQAPTLEKVFDNEQTASTSPWFEFTTLDLESDDITYQIQVDDAFNFSSPALDRNSAVHLSEFENLVAPADKDPFTVGQTVRFRPTSALSNNTTYYWRVRGRDGSGSNDWGEWSTVSSFTVNTATAVTTWFQTEREQFDTNENTNTETTAFDDVILTTGFTTGTTTSSAIDFDDKTTGNAWGSLSWSHNVTTGSIRYRVEYLLDGEWVLIPDSFLPGNAAGFTASPVSLLGLDPKVHNEIRIRANLTDSGGSPRLLSWSVSWGFAVEQPTLLALFDNERVGTTTPTFRFFTTDPENNDIQYQVSYSTSELFTSSTTVTSGISAGFRNEVVGIDTSPFFSGDTISYRVQTPLANGTTYWWRVRGRDPGGGGAWSVWSPVRSFTVDTGTTVSTWFQTTDAQFRTSTLNDLEGTGSGGVKVTSIIREAFLAYAEGVIQTPRYRLWNGSVWDVEQTGTSVGGVIRFVESAAAPTRDEYAIVTQESTGRVRAQIYNGVNDTTGNLHTVVSAVPGLFYRGFDVAYESSSGDAIVVACSGTEATYSVWNGTSWSGPTALPLAIASNCNWIQLASDPTSDEIILVARDAIVATGVDYEALVWNGSSWGNSTTFGNASEVNNEGIAVSYEESGDRAVVVVPDGANSFFRWSSWNGTAWGTSATVAFRDDFETGRLVRDQGSDSMVLCAIDQGGQLLYMRWNGATNAWITPFTVIDIAGNSKVGRPIGCEYETTPGRDGFIMIPYSDTTDARYQFFNGTALSGEQTISTIQDSFEVRSVRTGDGNILSMFYDDANTQYDFSFWNGTVWSTLETLEDTSIGTLSPPTIPLDIVARRFPTFTEGTIISDPIDFDEGSGLKWQRATFSDTTPGSSDIRYYVEYLDGNTWNLIPNSVLSGNSAGFTTSPIDLSQVSRITYNTIRLRGELACVGGNCPVLNDWSVEWSAGINVSGTLRQYNQTASTTAGTVAVAVNGVLQAGRTASVVNGSWTIPNVTAFPGDIVTTFVTGAADTAEAVGVTRYDGDGDITGITMFERHLSLGSNDATTTPLTNVDIGQFDFTNTEDVFANVTGSTLSTCATTGCADARLFIRTGTRYTPGGRFVTHDFINNGIFTAGSFTHEINGSWDNNATANMGGSTVVLAATSSVETIDNTGSVSGTFNNLTFGTTTGSGTWSPITALDIDGNLTVQRGTFARGATAMTVGGNFDVFSNGFISGIGTTTFDGANAATWRDQNATLQNAGRVVIDGSSKAVTLAGNVAAQSITIGANDTLDASAGNFDITVFGNWNNQNNFVARGGEVFFAATSTGRTITTTGDAFFDVTFSGTGGGWSFTENTALINNDVRVQAGTVTLPSATTTIAGSFLTTSGTFQHNNGTLLFTSASAESVTFAGTAFTNVARNLWFQGTGAWTMTDTNATSTGNVTVQQGTVNFNSGVLAIGGTLRDIGGVYSGGTGTVRFYSSSAQVLTAGGSSFNNVTFAGAGAWSFSDTNVSVSRNVTINQGTLTLPSVELLVAGSYDNNATVVPGTGTLQFNSNDTGETVDFGLSALNNVVFNNATGGWTIVSNGTTTNNLTITAATNLTVNTGVTLSVGGQFTNSVGGTATTWTGSTLALRAGNYALNTKTNTGDTYGTLRVDAGARIAMWNSSAVSYLVNSAGHLYSQDHAAVDGDLYIFGGYARTSGTEHWSHATDFDGAPLGVASRQVDVRFAAGSSATFTGATLNILGLSTASTTVANQGVGTYTVTVSGGTIDARFYEFSNLGVTGVSLLGATSVSQLNDGAFILNGGAAWYNSSWSRRIPITIPAGSVSSALSEFPVFVDLSLLPAEFFLNVRSDGGDIRITTADGQTELPREIAAINTGASTGEVYFEAPSISSSANTTFYIYFGNAGATDYAANATFGSQNVWTNGYRAVYHFNENPTAAAPQYRDSTGNSSATAVNMESGDLISTPAGGGANVDGVDESIQTNFNSSMLASTWEVFLNANGTQGACDGVMFSRGTGVNGMNIGACGNNARIGYHWENLGATAWNWTGGPTYPTNQWFLASLVVQSSGATIYSIGSGGVTSGSNTFTHNTSTINNLDFGWDSFGIGRSFNGSMSEARLSNVARSQDWLAATYNNLANVSTFITDGAVEPITSTSVGLTVSSTTINANPSRQITNVRFATASSGSAFNVAQTDGVPTSFWWFRDGTGNLYGEAFDNDTGNPGSIRFNDSSLVFTVSGTVYSDGGVTPLTGGTCNGSAQVVRVVVNGGTSYTGSCSPVDGSYSIAGVTVTGDPTITIYLDNASGGQRGTVVTRTPTGNITNADIYVNRVIVRHEDIDPLRISNLAVFDNDNDTDIRFTANSGALTVMAGNELFVWNGDTFTPSGVVTLLANAGSNGFDGTLYLDDNARFNPHASTTVTIGGRFVADSGALFNAGSSTVLMNATTSGKSITAAGPVTFNQLTFNGSGGTWNITPNITVGANMTITAGTVTGTGNITIPNGSLTGNGVLSLGAGTTTIARSNTLGGTSPWTFHNLQLGNGAIVGTTTPLFTATTTISGRLTIAAAHFLDAGSTTWDLAGSGTVFVENGTFLEDTSTIRYSGNGANVRSTPYYNLDINAGTASPTYTATGLGIIVANDLTIGGTSNTTFTLAANNPVLDVNGDVFIRSNGTFIASNSAALTVAQNFTNDGVFTSSGGRVTFDAATPTNVAAGNSSFGDVLINKTGTITFTEHATATGIFRIQAASAFTFNSGQQLAVGGTFLNDLGGTATTWTGSTLHLYNGANYSINTPSTSDSYGTLSVDGTAQIRMWNSDATVYQVDSTASLYSQDHANQAGDLYIWGAYRKNSGSDFWSFATDFDGSALGGGSRKVDVFMAAGASASFTGGSLQVLGTPTASTTIQNQGSGSYALTIGGTASTSLQYYEVTDINSNGLTLTGTPTINNLSNGNLEVSQNGGTAMTIGGTVITANPARNFNQNRFALNGVGSGFNVTATGTSNSAWRFANHYGDIDGEALDVDPAGDPGYISWDDSTALISVSGNVYSDEIGTVSSVCDGVTNNVTLRVAGITSYSTSCNATTGAYTISNVSYGAADMLVVYIDGEIEKGAAVTQDPITNVTGFSIYENRVVVRHEGTAPLTIDDMTIWDASDDSDVPYTAVSGSPDTLTLGANRKLVVASSKTFAPGGNVTLAGGGGGAAFDGTLELYSNADWVAVGTESLSIGGSMILGAGADYVAGTGTTTFTTSGVARTIDLNNDALHNVAFTGTGSWSITDSIFTANGNMLLTGGTVTFPTGTSTFNGSLINNGAAINANSGRVVFTGPASHAVRLGGSSLATTVFTGGNYTMLDVNATSTGSVTIESGVITLPSGFYSIGGNFANEGGSIIHNTSELVLRHPTAATLLASSSDLFAVRFAGGGSYTMRDRNITLLGSLSIPSGSVNLATGTIAIGGSFTATGGTFNHGSSTILFNSSDSGEVINPGVSNFYAVQIGAPTGGYTLTGNATTTHNFTLQSAANFAVQSGVTLRVGGVFTNAVGGTNTNWNASTLVLAGQNTYSINGKTTGGDQYHTLVIGQNSDIRMWNSAATTTTVLAGASLYSQDHATVNGFAYVYGDFNISTGAEYWSYATDFDGTNLIGSERAVTVRHAANATTTVNGGALQIIGVSGFETQVTNQGSGTYALRVTAGTLNAQRYDLRNLNAQGLVLSGSPTISSLAFGDYVLAVNGGSLITVSSSTVNANASLVIPGVQFATTSAITGTNVTLIGVTANAWTFTGHSGNLDGEAYDSDGVDDCGSIRWSDSECLITQQTHYRWRNDDGGIGVQASEWFNTNWDARKSVRIDNADATTYTNAVVQMVVAYDTDMQADFDDLRFTGADGVTPIPYWIGSSTVSQMAEVWVRVPSLPSEGTANIFMYYNNPTATSSESIDDTFLAADDFEDGDITEYSGQTGLFTAGTARSFDGIYNLDNTGDENGRANTGGIFRLDQVVSQGETFRFMQYINTTAGSGDETCVKFGVQNPGSANDNYAVCLEQFGTDRISLVRDAVDNDSSGVILASSTVTYTTGWYEVEVQWETDDDIIVRLSEADGTLITTISDNDTAYTSGGIGFTYWFHYGGWDSVTSRPTLTTEPSVRFGAEQTDGGATWKTAIDSPASYDAGDIARLRISIENSGLAITGQQIRLEYAPLAGAPSCEAVPSNTFSAVPPQSSCGTSPVCMQSSSFVTNGAAIADLLLPPAGLYTLGQVREDPSNMTTGINIGQNEYTEVEFAITPTANVLDETLCFRTTNNGTPFDTYLKVAQMTFQFTPSVNNVVLNQGLDINLLPGTTTAVYATGTAIDLNGAADLEYATGTIYRIGATGGAACTPNNNDCYVSSCSFTNCASDTCTVECRADIFFHADPTDAGAYAGQEWLAFIEVEDETGRYAFDDSIGVALNTLRAIDVNNSITYGAVAAAGNTGASNASTSIENLGNSEVNIEVEGTDMSDGAGSIIPVYEQKFATSTFTYSACTSCYTLSSTTPFELDIELLKPATSFPVVQDNVYWGVAVPFGTNSTPHSGINVFTPVSP